MKKLFCLLLAFVFLFLVSCNEAEKSEGALSSESSAESKAEQGEKNESKESESKESESKESESEESESKEPESEESESEESELSEASKDEIPEQSLSLDECEVRVVRTKGYFENSEFFKKALNAEKLSDKTSLNLPIYVIESTEDVARVGGILKESSLRGGIYYEDSAFAETMKNADEEFFETTMVFLTYFLSGTGSCEYVVTDVDENGTFTVAQKEYPYDVVTADEAGWFFFVLAPKGKADKLDNVDAVFSLEEYKEK